MASQRLLDIAASADAEEGKRQGLEDVKKARTRPAREFFDEFKATHGMPRYYQYHYHSTCRERSRPGVQASQCGVFRRSELRHLLYGPEAPLYPYRVTYPVLEKQKHVEVLHIRRGARRKISLPTSNESGQGQPRHILGTTKTSASAISAPSAGLRSGAIFRTVQVLCKSGIQE
jgi:hypothetical protein